MGSCPSHLQLSRYKTGDLKQLEAEAVLNHLNTCDKCRALSSSMDANISDFENGAEHRLKDLLEAMDQQPIPLAVKRPIAKQAIFVGGLFAAAAAALLIMTLGIQKQSPSATDADISFKGAFSMQAVADRDGNQFAVNNGTSLTQGDAIRFVVTVDRPGYLTVFSKDAKGALSPFYPDTPPSADSKPMTVDAAGKRELQGSIVLDDSQGKEEFVVIFSPHSFSRVDIHAMWSEGHTTGGAASLGKDFAVETITVQKEPPRKK
jgi:hypothetical protein